MLFGLGPQAYKEFDIIVNTNITFINSKLKTVDSSILRLYLEFGFFMATYIFYLIYRYLGSFSLFLFYIIIFGLSNEGILSVFGVIGLKLLHDTKHN